MLNSVMIANGSTREVCFARYFVEGQENMSDRENDMASYEKQISQLAQTIHSQGKGISSICRNGGALVFCPVGELVIFASGLDVHIPSLAKAVFLVSAVVTALCKTLLPTEEGLLQRDVYARVILAVGELPLILNDAWERVDSLCQSMERLGCEDLTRNHSSRRHPHHLVTQHTTQAR